MLTLTSFPAWWWQHGVGEVGESSTSMHGAPVVYRILTKGEGRSNLADPDRRERAPSLFHHPHQRRRRSRLGHRPSDLATASTRYQSPNRSPPVSDGPPPHRRSPPFVIAAQSPCHPGMLVVRATGPGDVVSLQISVSMGVRSTDYYCSATARPLSRLGRRRYRGRADRPGERESTAGQLLGETRASDPVSSVARGDGRWILPGLADGENGNWRSPMRVPDATNQSIIWY